MVTPGDGSWEAGKAARGVCCRAGDGTMGLDLGEQWEGLQAACLVSSRGGLWVSRGSLLGLGGIKPVSCERGVKKGWTVESTGDVERRERRMHLLLCCNDGGETGGLNFGAARELWVLTELYFCDHLMLSIK